MLGANKQMLKFDKNELESSMLLKPKILNMIKNIQEDESHVDIFLPHGIMVRGVLKLTDSETVLLIEKPAVHSQHGIKAYEKIVIDKNQIIAIGYNSQDTD
jgi:sRNA-binding regulator protein Hfq